jgi:hypothetical protein
MADLTGVGVATAAGGDEGQRQRRKGDAGSQEFSS